MQANACWKVQNDMQLLEILHSNPSNTRRIEKKAQQGERTRIVYLITNFVRQPRVQFRNEFAPVWPMLYLVLKIVNCATHYIVDCQLNRSGNGMVKVSNTIDIISHLSVIYAGCGNNKYHRCYIQSKTYHLIS